MHRIPVRLSALVLALCLIFSLMMPINALGTTTLCGKEEHSHNISCYVDAADDYACIAGLGADHILHSHSAACYGVDGALYCTLTELAGHSHTDECYIPAHSHGEACVEKVKGDLICTISDTEVHSHSEGCYTEKDELVCTQEESAAHSHAEACYSDVQKLSCTLEENDEHSHSEACYSSEKELSCTLPESEGHAHSDTCYEKKQNLVCILSDTEAHAHVDACYSWTDKTICQLEEREQPELKCTQIVYTLHSHNEACYSEGQLLCTYPQVIEHSHTIECLGLSAEELTLLCKKEEHVHEEDKCYIDLYADLETATEWERTLPKKLSGDWPADLLAVAVSQLGYTESARNVVLQGENIKGYTRYGEWYGAPHENWCAMFISFCLHYAGIPEEAFPYDSNCARWMDALSAKNLFTTDPNYMPKAGDLIFLYDKNTGDETPVHNGIVSSVKTEEKTDKETGEKKTVVTVTAIEGNTWANDVRYSRYELGNAPITGFAVMPENPDYVPRPELPECDCAVAESEDGLHKDSCAYIAGLNKLCDEKSAAELAELWPALDESERKHITDRLSADEKQAEKLRLLKAFIDGVSFSVGSAAFNVAGNLPDGLELNVSDANYSKEQALAYLNPNISADFSWFRVYDISLKSQGEDYKCESPVKLTVSSPEFNPKSNEQLMVAHLDATTGQILQNYAPKLRGETLSIETDGFSPYMFYIVDKDIYGGERNWGTNWLNLVGKTRSAETTGTESAVSEEAAATAAVDSSKSAVQIVNAGGSIENAEDGVVVSKILTGTELENVFDISLNVRTTTNLNDIYHEPDAAVCIVMDISNSMLGDLNESQSKLEAALAAADSIAEQFAANNTGASRIGFAAFNTNAVEISPMQAVSSTAQLNAFKADYFNDVVTIVTADGYGSSDKRYSNMEAGLRMGSEMLSACGNANKYIILLSDGMVSSYVDTFKDIYTGYVPVSTSGIKDSDGVFYDRINNKFLEYGASYSDKGAQRAAAMAYSIKNSGISICSVGVGVDSFQALHKDEKGNTEAVMMDAEAYINDGLDRAAGIGAYAGDPGPATVDNYFMDRADFTVGDITDTGKDAVRPWLKDNVASGTYYDSTEGDKIKAAWQTIYDTLIANNQTSASNVWFVDDSIPYDGAQSKCIEFIGFYDSLYGELMDTDVDLSNTGSELLQNTASYDPTTNKISWDLKQSPVSSSVVEDETWYSYTLRYRIRLMTERLDFEETGSYVTNGTTTLHYQAVSESTGLGQAATMLFPVPSVKGWHGELLFKKLSDTSQPISGAVFTLKHDTENCGHCRGDYVTQLTIADRESTSDKNGLVRFLDLPSGHSYVLTETVVPAGYVADGREYKVSVSYDATSVSVKDEKGKTQQWTGQIINKAVYEMPRTGGPGTDIFYVAGAALLAMAVFIFVVNLSIKRRRG